MTPVGTQVTRVRFFNQPSTSWSKWKMLPTACVWSTFFLEVGCLWKRDDGLMLTVSQTPLMTDDNPVRRASQIPWIPHPFPYGRVTWND